MNTKEKFVITINRLFGSGGHEIGEELAEALGVKLIDKQITQALADRFNISEEQAEKMEEKRRNILDDFSLFYKSFNSMHFYDVNKGNEITSRQLYNAETAFIKNIAEIESCVVVGRCGFHIFKDHPNSLRLFIHSDNKSRIDRIASKYYTTDEEALEMIHKFDKRRISYTKYCTDKLITDATNYDICINTTNYTISQAVSFILSIIEKQNEMSEE